MADDENETFSESNQAEQDDENDEKVLRLVFEESKSLRNEFAGRLIYNSDKIWSLQNVLMVLLGAYITFFTFIFGDGKDVVNKISINFPMYLCFIFLAIALFLTIKGIVPQYKLFAPNPQKIYPIIADDQKKALKDFIGTYLNNYKETLIIIDEVNALRKKIIHIEVYSITEFSLSALILTADNKYTDLINIVSLLLLTLFTADYMHIVCSEKEKIKSHIKELNSESDKKTKENE